MGLGGLQGFRGVGRVYFLPGIQEARHPRPEKHKLRREITLFNRLVLDVEDIPGP